MKTLHIVVITVCLLLLAQPLMACPFDTGGHLVKINVVDSHSTSYGFNWLTPIENATVTAVGIKTEAPDWFWLIIGATAKETNIELIERNATTDEYGVAILPLYDAMLYNVTVTCDNGKATVLKLYPHESEYIIYTGC